MAEEVVAAACETAYAGMPAAYCMHCHKTRFFSGVPSEVSWRTHKNGALQTRKATKGKCPVCKSNVCTIGDGMGIPAQKSAERNAHDIQDPAETQTQPVPE
jgi:hypothetical protein